MAEVFDRRMIDEIYEGDKALFCEIMDIVCGRLPKDIIDMNNLVLSADYGELRNRVHKMKSALVSVAAEKAAKKAQDLESTLEKPEKQQVSRLYNELAFEIRDLIRYYSEGTWQTFF